MAELVAEEERRGLDNVSYTSIIVNCTVQSTDNLREENILKY